MSATPFESAPLEQTDGFLVVLRPGAVPEAYLAMKKVLAASSAEHQEFLLYWKELLAALPGVDPRRYAGWDRDPVERGRAEATSGPEEPRWPNYRAERLLTERLGEDPNLAWSVTYVSPAVFADLDLGREILAATDVPEDQEVIRVVRLVEAPHEAPLVEAAEYAVPETLGFDVGFWGGPFSLISDTMIYPRWHPAPEEDYAELREHSAVLNDNLLFSTAEDARSFRAWYRSKPWAEEEWDIQPFTIARIDSV